MTLKIFQLLEQLDRRSSLTHHHFMQLIFTSISFPVLKSLERFEVNTSTPLNVTLEPIQTISKYMSLVGNVTA